MTGRTEQVDFGKVSSRIPLLAERLSAFPEVAAVHLFGSLAKGTPRKLSDVDIAVTLAEEPGGREKGDLTRRLEYVAAAAKALGTDRLDLVVLNTAPLPLRHAVFRDGKLVFVRDPRVWARFREESLRRYLDTIRLRDAHAAAFFRRIREHGFGHRAPGR